MSPVRLLTISILFIAAACSGKDVPPDTTDAGADPSRDGGSSVERDAGPSVERDGGAPTISPGWHAFGGMPEGSGRWGARLVHVPDPDRFLMFGGSAYPDSGGGALGDLWSFDVATETWTELQSTGTLPEARYCHCFAYLPDTHEILLVGGRDRLGPRPPAAFVLSLDDLTWRSTMSPVPTGVIGCSAEWMPNIGRALVVGGGGRTAFDNMTWLYNPAIDSFETVPVTNQPPNRADADSGYDPARGVVVLFGGVVSAVPPYEHRSDLWTFDGTDWTEQTFDVGPAARRFAATGIDEVNRKWWLFSGTNEDADFIDLWALDLDTYAWRAYPVDDAPEARAFAASAWHPPTQTMTMFGGLTRIVLRNLADGWRFRP